ncbi:MAG: FmdE family protein [Candidatus Zixiibacteriota bacterium]|jgi:formylmethanofuran dehydrogenase subunit E
MANRVSTYGSREMELGNPYRRETEALIAVDDLHALLAWAGELHGHYCNYLAYGVMAASAGVKELGVAHTGTEELVAVVETNNCFADGVQYVSGCTLGNNSLIYRDYGKTAVTFCTRDGRAVRYALAPEFEDSRAEEFPEASDLFDRLVARREAGTAEERSRMLRLLCDMSLRELGAPVEHAFRVTRGTIDVPSTVPVLDKVKCGRCGENVARNRAVEADGIMYCIPCAGEAYVELNGAGMELRG